MADDKDRSLQMFVIDVLRYDTEQIPSIVRLLNDVGCVGWRKAWPRDFTAVEVAQSLYLSYQENYITIFWEDKVATCIADQQTPVSGWEELLDDTLWFALTPAAWRKWDQWDPPILD